MRSGRKVSTREMADFIIAYHKRSARFVTQYLIANIATITWINIVVDTKNGIGWQIGIGRCFIESPRTVAIGLPCIKRNYTVGTNNNTIVVYTIKAEFERKVNERTVSIINSNKKGGSLVKRIRGIEGNRLNNVFICTPYGKRIGFERYTRICAIQRERV